jgi:hypothetical protein
MHPPESKRVTLLCASPLKGGALIRAAAMILYIFWGSERQRSPRITFDLDELDVLFKRPFLAIPFWRGMRDERSASMAGGALGCCRSLKEYQCPRRLPRLYPRLGPFPFQGNPLPQLRVSAVDNNKNNPPSPPHL